MDEANEPIFYEWILAWLRQKKLQCLFMIDRHLSEEFQPKVCNQ
jgi:hypothetical protein